MWITRLFSQDQDRNDGWTQPQREALIDLLLVSMFEDKHLSLNEDARLREQEEALQWEAPSSIDLHVDARTATIRSMIASPEAKEDLIASINERLGDYEAKQRAFYLAESMMAADGKTAAELKFLDHCKTLMGL